MFLIEQVVAPALLSRGASSQNSLPTNYARAPATSSPPDSPVTPGAPDLDFELEMELNALGVKTRDDETRRNPRMFTLGLVIHSLADGMALGAANALSAAPNPSNSSPAEGTNSGSVSEKASGLSFIVFIAIAIHKGKVQTLCNGPYANRLSCHSTYCLSTYVDTYFSIVNQENSTTPDRLLYRFSTFRAHHILFLDLLWGSRKCRGMDWNSANVLGTSSGAHIGRMNFVKRNLS